jgi:hypothetical protein
MINIVYSKNMGKRNVISQMITEDLLFNNRDFLNLSLKSFGGMIEKIVEEGDTKTIYIREINHNLILG